MLRKLFFIIILVAAILATIGYFQNVNLPETINNVSSGMGASKKTIKETFQNLKIKIHDTVAEKVSRKITINIGILLPLTGSQASEGEAVQTALNSALEKIRKTDTRYNYHLYFEDTKSSTSGKAAANRLIKNRKKPIDVLLSVGGSYREIAQNNRLPHISCSWANSSDGIWSFNNKIPLNEYTRIMKQILQKHQAKKVYLIGSENIESNLMQEQIEKMLQQNNIKLVGSKNYKPNTDNYRAIMPRLKVTRPDVIITLLPPTDLSKFINQYHEAKVNILLTAPSAFAFVKDKTPLEEYLFAAPASSALDYDTECAASMTDSLNLLVKACENVPVYGKLPLASTVAKELRKLKDYKGVYGKLNARPDGRIISQAFLSKIKNSKVTVVDN